MKTKPVGSINLKADFPFFRRTWNRVVAALLAVSFVPLMLIGGLMYVYSASALKEKTIDSLRMSVLHHKNSLDRYIMERGDSLKLVAAALAEYDSQSPEDLQNKLSVLHQRMPYFTDIGVIDSEGRHVAYDGPYDLSQRNYKNARWFLKAAASDLYISDVYLGFRNVPHVIITIRQEMGSGWRLVRATLEASSFNELVLALPEKGGIDAFLVNAQGIFQTSPKISGKVMAKSSAGVPEYFEGVRLIIQKDRIVAETWLNTAPWMFAAQIDRNIFSKQMNRVRNVGLFIFFLGSVLIVFTVLITTNYLVNRLENIRRNLYVLNEQLKRNAHSASAIKLTGRILADLKTSLINTKNLVEVIDSSASRQNQSENDREVVDTLTSELNRNLELVGQLARLTDPIDETYIISETDVSKMVGELADLLVQGLFSDSIAVETDFAPDLPLVRIERAQVRRTIQEAILTCLAAIGPGGTIRLVTSLGDKGIDLKIFVRNAKLAPILLDHHVIEGDMVWEHWEESDPTGSPARHWTIKTEVVREKGRSPYYLIQFLQPTEHAGERIPRSALRD